MIDVLTCPACGGAKSSLFDEREVHGIALSNRMCCHCGLVYLSRRMTDEDLQNFYRRGYRELNDGSELPNGQNLLEQRARTQHLVDVARAMAPHVSRHLDIGCSTGTLMMGMREAFQCEAVGIEPGVEHRKIALAQGLRVYTSIEEAAKERIRFDLITLSHVLEHMPDPAGTLTRIRRQLLSDSGYALIEVPNLYGHACFEPAHLFSFTAKTLHDALRLGGFEPIYTKLHGVPRSSWRPRYLLTVARPVAQSTRMPARAWGGIHSARLRRRWGMRNSQGILQLVRVLGRRMNLIV